ncbi:Mitochondrial intermembrane space import and assembly protein 40 [Armadillidium nasatum]|uniref:Mitochondrial intermembrane space import and assembly protein 40 n=1 Tax=Armadillidium nasatum TaxID=96803 RepID=A0A5N5STQ7_9CRUS|nr:Mitochondrial intermembrane space import and assembly protein 40 [Armadillidium nasatum]
MLCGTGGPGYYSHRQCSSLLTFNYSYRCFPTCLKKQFSSVNNSYYRHRLKVYQSLVYLIKTKGPNCAGTYFELWLKGYSGKDQIIFATEEDHKIPSKVPFPDEDEDDKPVGLVLPDGKINWECPCLGGMATGPCGVEFREAFSCFHYSKADPKGSDCLEPFKTNGRMYVSLSWSLW